MLHSRKGSARGDAAKRAAYFLLVEDGMTSVALTVLVALAALLLAIAIAFVPLRLMVYTIGKNVRAWVQRRRERRSVARATPDRRENWPG